MQYIAEGWLNKVVNQGFKNLNEHYSLLGVNVIAWEFFCRE
jgi:hypothetical protein